MTTKQSEINRHNANQKKIADEQNKASEKIFKKQSRLTALEVAKFRAPMFSDVTSLVQKPPAYNLLKEAQAIYQWLIKDV